MKFPAEMGAEIGGKSFETVFETNPKIIELVISRWDENGCSGVFLDFFKYVKLRLQNPLEREAHEDRCVAYIKRLDKIPSYLLKYKNANKSPPRV